MRLRPSTFYTTGNTVLSPDYLPLEAGMSLGLCMCFDIRNSLKIDRAVFYRLMCCNCAKICKLLIL